MHIILSLAVFLFQTYSGTTELKYKLKLHYEEIDRISQVVSTQAEPQKFVAAVFDNFGSLETVPDRRFWKEHLAAAELRVVRGEGSRISEKEIASAYNAILDELGLPDDHVGPEQVHQIRVNYSRIYPKLLGRTIYGSVAVDSRPVESALMVLQLDRIYSEMEIPARLQGDKAASQQYQASVERYLHAKQAWLKSHRDGDFQRVARDVAIRIHVQ